MDRAPRKNGRRFRKRGSFQTSPQSHRRLSFLRKFSRAWGLWALHRRTADPRFLDLYLPCFQKTFENPQDGKGDYHEVGHRVAQSGMLGLL